MINRKLLILIGLLCLCALSQAPAPAADPFQEAVKAYNAKNYRAAYSQLEFCLKKSPADVNALYYEALCCYQLKDVAGARQRYQRIIQVAPDNPAANLARTALSNLAASGKSQPATASVAQPNPGAATSAANIDAVKNLINQIQPTSTGGAQPAEKTAQQIDPLYDLPLRVVKNKDVVDMEVNGRKVSTIIDPSIHLSIISQQTADQCHVDSSVPPSNRRMGTNTVGGDSLPMGSAKIRLGPIEKELTVAVSPVNFFVAGNCIGQDLLEGWRFTIDRERGFMHFFH